MQNKTYTKTVGGTYSPEYTLHINGETHWTVRKHPNTDLFSDNCPYCKEE